MIYKKQSFLLCFFLALLGLLIGYIIKDELNNRQEDLEYSTRGKLIFEFNYKKEYWVEFAKLLHRFEIHRYFKPFSIVTFCLIIFLILLMQDDDLSVFITFSFTIGMIWLPIFITNVLRFRNRKKYYLDNAKPNIKVTSNGVIINSKIHHSFTYINSKLYDVKIENFNKKKCFIITTHHSNHRRGAHFKTSYVPIPNDEKNTELYLRELKTIAKLNF